MHHGRLGAALALAAAAIPLCAAILASCVDPLPAPSGAAEVLAAWDLPGGEAGPCARITIRLACSGELAAERFGATVRVDTETRRYWASIEEESYLPAGASTTRTLEIPFAATEERSKPGSAAVESCWFE